MNKRRYCYFDYGQYIHNGETREPKLDPFICFYFGTLGGVFKSITFEKDGRVEL